MKVGLLVLICIVVAPGIRAEVTDVSASGFTSEHVLVLDAPPAEAFAALTADVAAWWDATHSYGLDPAAFSFELRPGGCFCEALPNGGFVEHMRVVNVMTDSRLVLQGALGPLQTMGVTGHMIFEFRPHDDGSELHYRYVVGGYVGGGLEAMAGPVDQVQLGQLLRLQKFVATGQALNP